MKNFIFALSILCAVGAFCGIPIVLEGHEHEAVAPTAYVCPMCPDVSSPKPGKCPSCGMDLVLMDGDHKTGAVHSTPTIRAEIVAFPPYHAAGNDVPTILRLTDLKGKPVQWEDLGVAHTKRIHLLIIDESMTDYSHEHPEPTKMPGEYRFVFKPQHGGRYHAWADLMPRSTGKQEYSKTEIKVDGKAEPFIGATNTTSLVDGYRFTLSVENKQALRVGKAAMLIVKVIKPGGEPADNLEPVMGAFAHGVGFPRSLDSVMHVHPMGKEPARDSDRGGPDLKFHIVPEKPGWLKFYVQVQIGGQSKFAGFGLNVSP